MNQSMNEMKVEEGGFTPFSVGQIIPSEDPILIFKILINRNT